VYFVCIDSAHYNCFELTTLRVCEANYQKRLNGRYCVRVIKLFTVRMHVDLTTLEAATCACCETEVLILLYTVAFVSCNLT